MNKVNLLTIAIIGLIIINMVSLFLLYHKNDRPPHLREHLPREPRDIIIERLHMDEDQQRKYLSLIKIHHQHKLALDDSIGNAKQILYGSVVNSAMQKRDSLINEIAKLNSSMERLHYNHFNDIKNLCNAAQKKDFELLAQDFKEIFTRPHPKR